VRPVAHWELGDGEVGRTAQGRAPGQFARRWRRIAFAPQEYERAESGEEDDQRREEGEEKPVRAIGPFEFGEPRVVRDLHDVVIAPGRGFATGSRVV